MKQGCESPPGGGGKGGNGPTTFHLKVQDMPIDAP